MTEPTTPAAQPVTAAQLVAAHETYLRCVSAAVRQQRRGATQDVIANIPGAVELGQAALTVMAVTTARFVARVAGDLGIEPALLWARFSADETATVAARTRPDAPAEPGEEDTQP
jgi:hypothetical protein